MHVGKQSATILAAKRLTGVAQEVNLRECILHLHQVRIRPPTLVSKPRGDITRSPKQVDQWPHKKGPQFFLNPEKSDNGDKRLPLTFLNGTNMMTRHACLGYLSKFHCKHKELEF